MELPGKEEAYYGLQESGLEVHMNDPGNMFTHSLLQTRKGKFSREGNKKVSMSTALYYVQLPEEEKGN